MRPTPKWRLITAAAIVLMFLGLGTLLWITLGSGEEEHGAEAGETAAGGAPAGGAPSTVAITIKDFLYSPALPLVAPDGRATWTQQDIIAHTVTSGTRGAANAGSLFDSTLSTVGQTFSYTFAQAGTFPYFCRFHENMQASVIVGDQAALAQAQASPTPAPTPKPFAVVPPGVVQPPPAAATLIAAQLQNPRGFTWGPDGALYVAEAGTPQPLNLPGTQTVASRTTLLFCEGWNQQTGDAPPAECPQQPPQRVRTGRISRVSADGRQDVVLSGLPVIAGMFGFTEGPASVAFIGNDMYLLLVAEDTADDTIPASQDTLPSGVYRVNSNGSGMLIANLHAFAKANPPAFVPPDWGDGELYDMLAFNNKLYVSDGNASVVYEVDPAAPMASRTRKFADLSTMDGGHPVLTGLSVGTDNNLYVTNLTKAPYPVGGAQVWRMTPAGQISQVATGFTLAVGVAAISPTTFYVAEFAKIDASQNPPIVPGGRLMRATAGSSPTTVLENLFYPTVIRRGPDGMLYVTYFSIGADNGTAPGAIYRLNAAP